MTENLNRIETCFSLGKRVNGVECHSQSSKILQGGLLLDKRQALLRGGDSGPSLNLDAPGQSLFLDAIGYAGDIQMPPSGKLSESEIALLKEWVLRGAPMPVSEQPVIPSERSIDFAKARDFWSFRPLKKSNPPTVYDTAWSKRRIDAFILAKLEAADHSGSSHSPGAPNKRGLSPSGEADRRTLLRRAAFDLTGLPPTLDEAERFINDTAPGAYEQLIERLLASPQYGERWGRHWLDLVRYCDVPESYVVSEGRAWLYRDWVVSALNDDLPYDDFVRMQFAADLLPRSETADVAALGMLGLSPVQWKELKLAPDVIEAVVAEEWEERIHAVSSTFLGLTVACARCHDHKFDPISTEDYYALAGVFASIKQTDRLTVPEATAAPKIAARAQLRKLRAELQKLEAAKNQRAAAQAKILALRFEIAAIEKVTPDEMVPLAFAVEEASLKVVPDGTDRTKLEYHAGEAQDVAVQIRGNPTKLGRVVPRRFLTVLSTEPAQPFRHGSGRLELADAIVRDAAPLTARVIVNRVWAHHFGRGLVETLSDFGAQGSPPSHPELLDDLAARFVEHNWSLKWLHREIVLSATYRQSSGHDAEKHAQDPENRLLWRMNRRRLEIESWRDAMLSVSGLLQVDIGGPAAELNNTTHRRRTLYGVVTRSDLNDVLRLNDFPDPTAHNPRRDITTTPLQQLFALNSPFVVQQATALLTRLEQEASPDTSDRIELAYRLLFSRLPTPKQAQLGRDFLSSGTGDASSNAWRQYLQAMLISNEFMFVD